MEWKEKYSKLKNSHDALQKKMDGMERYFEDLPTVEESSKKDKLVCNSSDHNAHRDTLLQLSCIFCSLQSYNAL